MELSLLAGIEEWVDGADESTRHGVRAAGTTLPVRATASIRESVVLMFEATANVAAVAEQRIQEQAVGKSGSGRTQWQTAATLASAAAKAISATAIEARTGDSSVWTAGHAYSQAAAATAVAKGVLQYIRACAGGESESRVSVGADREWERASIMASATVGVAEAAEEEVSAVAQKGWGQGLGR
jgi:hypothetical protein